MRLVRGILVGVVVVLSLSLALPALAADVTGQWKAEFDTPVGVQKYTFDLKVDGEKLTGKAAFERMGQTGEAELKEGKVSGDTVSFVETFDAQGMRGPRRVHRQAAGGRDPLHAQGGGVRYRGVRRDPRQEVTRYAPGRVSSAVARRDLTLPEMPLLPSPPARGHASRVRHVFVSELDRQSRPLPTVGSNGPGGSARRRP